MASPESPGSSIPDTTRLELFTITNPAGIRLDVLNYGGIIQSLFVPDAKGNTVDIVLGYDDPSQYFGDKAYFGAITGRYANRIAKCTFLLDGQKYSLTKNNGPHHLHGGIRGFNKVFWNVQKYQENGEHGIRMHYLSKDGEEGYPGNLDVRVSYWLTRDNELYIDYFATTDKATVINLTQHSYFNLAGSGDILNHHLQVFSTQITSTDPAMLPDGLIRDITNSPFDFSRGKNLGNDILKTGLSPTGYDNNYVLSADISQCAAKLTDPVSGRILELFTDQPGMQLYTANYLDGTVKGKNGQLYKPFSGICLETQHFPDSPNRPQFPNTILRPGDEFLSRTIYKFLTAEL